MDWLGNGCTATDAARCAVQQKVHVGSVVMDLSLVKMSAYVQTGIVHTVGA